VGIFLRFASARFCKLSLVLFLALDGQPERFRRRLQVGRGLTDVRVTDSAALYLLDSSPFGVITLEEQVAFVM
jgi:hypothetical protein